MKTGDKAQLTKECQDFMKTAIGMYAGEGLMDIPELNESMKALDKIFTIASIDIDSENNRLTYIIEYHGSDGMVRTFGWKMYREDLTPV